ncbi:MAG: 50S ribosomal protein L10 [Christensenellaceae bacterium]|nr:50S ribosomal protein L10 [Christensenellaceae bacterium]
MASKTIREQKENHVFEIQSQLSSAKAFVLVDYKGLTVAQDTELRNTFRTNGVVYRVLKNRLLKIALNNLGYTQFDESLNGTTALAFSTTDVIAPAKIISEKAFAFKKMKIKCGMLEGAFIGEEQCKELAQLPSREVLIAQLLAMLQAPIASFARAIDAIAKKKAEA